MPSMDELKESLAGALGEDYEESSVDVIACPDLHSWGLLQEGLGGKNVLVDVGGEAFCHNPKYHHTRSDIAKVANACGMPTCAVLGAGCGCKDALHGHWAEVMIV